MTDQEKELRMEYLMEMMLHKADVLHPIYVEIGNIIDSWESSLSNMERLASLGAQFNTKSNEMLALYGEYKTLYDELHPAPIPEP